MTKPLDADALDRLFRHGRTFYGFTDRQVSEAQVHQLYELAKWGPTASNSSPARFVFVTSEAGRTRLAPYLSNSNRSKPLGGAVQVIVAYDLAFAEKLPQLMPQNPGSAAYFTGAVAEETAIRNGTLQGGYLMLAARALGLDCGPMSGFDRAGVDAEFFAGTTWRANFVCNIGYGAEESLRVRNPRLTFEEACQTL